MEMLPLVPVWLTWAGAGVLATLGLAVLVRGLEAVLDLDVR